MRALFCPLASHGFVYPAIAVASALRRRGHDVAFVTSASFRDELARQGLARIPRGASDGPSFAIERWFHPLEVAMQAKHIEYALDRFAPDVLVAHPLSLGALLVRERLGLPTAVLGLAVHLWRSRTGASEATARRLAWRRATFVGYLEEARALFRRAPSPRGEDDSTLEGDLFMLQSVPELEPEPAQGCHLVGACLWEPPADEELRAWLGDGDAAPLVYVHHGRAFDHPSFWPTLVEVLGTLPVRVAASLGRMGRPAGPLPPSFYVRDHLGQQAVLPRANLVVCSGNSTVVLGALTHGVPALVLPADGAEQLDAADALQRAGSAIAIAAEEVTAPALQRAVTALLSEPGYRERARALAQAFRRYDGPARVARLIEGLAGDTSEGAAEAS